MRITLRDVAKDAGVSMKTVSRVVNGDPRVLPGTEQRIRESIARLGYRPNLAARSLRSGSDDTVGIVVDSVADPFFAAIVGALEDLLEPHGFSVLSASTRGQEDRERKVISSLAQRSVRGCILAPWHTTSVPADLEGIPLVFIDRLPAGIPADAVLVEDFESSRHAVTHLIEHGHRRIAFLGDNPILPTTRDRLRGYLTALRDAGIEPDPSLQMDCCPDALTASTSTKKLLAAQSPPTAIFIAGSRQAAGVVSAMSERQRHRVALISFGDLAIANAIRPALTVIQHDQTAIARDAVKLLLRRIADPTAEPQVIRQRLALIQRGSGELIPRG